MNELIEEALTKQIIGAAIEVHRYWGPDLVERLYDKSLAVEFVEAEQCRVMRTETLNLRKLRAQM